MLIDAFVAEPYSLYAALGERALEQLSAAAAPFDSVDLALASHVHRDHFQPAAACAFLEAAPEFSGLSRTLCRRARIARAPGALHRRQCDEDPQGPPCSKALAGSDMKDHEAIALHSLNGQVPLGEFANRARETSHHHGQIS